MLYSCTYQQSNAVTNVEQMNDTTLHSPIAKYLECDQHFSKTDCDGMGMCCESRVITG